MTVPAFDDQGNLPVGDLFDPASHRGMLRLGLPELKATFVDQMRGSSTRGTIWQGWMEHRRAIEAVGINYVTMVNGSCVTAKEDPNDVDLCILFNAHELVGLAASARTELTRLFNVPQCKLEYRCDAYAMAVVPAGNTAFPTLVHHLTYWARVFGKDRAGADKSFVLVDERGTI
jgi:hypothetical protein